jgi:hypothetical protein
VPTRPRWTHPTRRAAQVTGVRQASRVGYAFAGRSSSSSVATGGATQVAFAGPRAEVGAAAALAAEGT